MSLIGMLGLLLFILCAVAVLLKWRYVRYYKSIYKGKLPVRFFGWFGRNLRDGASARQMREYMTASNYYALGVWLSLIAILFYTVIHVM